MRKVVICCLILMLVLFVAGPVLNSRNKIADDNEESKKVETVNSEITSVETTSEEQTEKETEKETDASMQPVEINIRMVGDMLMHDYVQTNGMREDGTYNYDHLFANVKNEISTADVAVVNQEVLIGGDELGIQNYPRFNCRHEVGDAIAAAGFDVVLHATNHTMDQGVDGVINCMNFWETNHPEIKYLGIHKSEEESREIYVYEKDGFRVSMLNYTYGLNGSQPPSDKKYLIDILDEDKVRDDIRRAKEISDCIVVFPHWGTEYSLEISSEQKKWAKIFADEGVTLVIGTHPHVIEPVEWVEGTDGNSMLVYYSLGNFVSAQDKAEAMLGAMADVTLLRDETGNVIVKDYKAIPLVTHRQAGTASVTTYKLSDYTEELSQANRIRRNDSSFSIAKMNDIWNQVMGQQ